MKIYTSILDSILQKRELLAVLLDPDKIFLPDIKLIVNKIDESEATHIFVGGSTVKPFQTEILIEKIKIHTQLPVIIFPGDVDQISDKADALLFLSLISGRNPEYLIGKQVKAAASLRHIELEVIPTSYILLGTKNFSAVEDVTQTQPMPMNNIEAIINTAYAGKLLGHKLIYLEAGSGASANISLQIIRAVKEAVDTPLIVGGGITDKLTIKESYRAGADMVVIGTAFEKNLEFFNEEHKKRIGRKDFI